MPNIDLSILNQRQTPAFYADVFANRPAAGFVGRIFVSTDTYAFYRDNGTSWDLIGGPGTGTVTGTGANGQVTFWNGASTITGSNDLFWDATNGHFGVNTNAPGTALDVHHDQPTVAILNQTVATNDVRIGFQNNGVGLWRIGAFYNAGANDFGIYDAVAAIQPVTVKKTTGQVLIGTSTVGSGKLVVASASSDNGIQIVGASAPSLRIDSAESGPTKRAGLGISTATNNFIQGSADRDFCIFNGSTAAASPILFGIYDAGAVNVQEAARISASRNLLINTTTDNGSRLQVYGTSTFTAIQSGFAATITNVQDSSEGLLIRASDNDTGLYLLRLQSSVGATSQSWVDRLLIDKSGAATFSSTTTSGGNYLTSAAQIRFYNVANNNWTELKSPKLSGDTEVDFQITTKSGQFYINATGNVGIGTIAPTEKLEIINGSLSVSTNQTGASIIYGRIAMFSTGAGGGYVGYGGEIRSYSGAGIDQSDLRFYTSLISGATERARITTGGNLLIGTTTDNGYKLRVNGNVNVDGYISTSPSVNGIFCNINQHNTTVTLSSIFPNLNFTNTFISLNLQIIASSGSVTNATSFIYNCVRDYNGNWSSTLVNTVGTVAVLTLTFGGTNAAPTLTITGVSFMTVTYNISILI